MINGGRSESAVECDRKGVVSKNREVQQQILSVDTAEDHVQRMLAEELEHNPYKHVLCDVLQEITQQSLSLQKPTSFENEQQMVRLDSMLASEGITGPENNSVTEVSPEQREYQEKISILRKVYQEEMSAYEKACQNFQGPVLALLEQQATLRPVPQAEKEVLLAHIQIRFQGIELQLKESICQAVILLRNRVFDARRKRQNFTQTATVILNEYFYNNLSNPYPSEQVKQELAASCNLTVAQVTNWFGNKRIRFKKSFGKSDDEILSEETHDIGFGDTIPGDKDNSMDDAS